jgi:phospholipid/cholesterol/gamma-HCH transport system permease protein
MKVTEQIDAMEVAGNNPYKYIVVTRILAATIMLPVLVILADVVSLYGAYVGVNLKGEVSFRLFFLQVFEKLAFMDIVPAIIKTFFFGFAVGLIGTFKGYHASNGTEGVGKAANTAVIIGSLSVFILDMIAVQITSLLI